MPQLNVVIERKIPKELFQVFASVGFWNSQGRNVYEQNKAGTMGGKWSQQQAQKLSYEDFVLRCLHADIQTFAASKQPSDYWPEGFLYGTTDRNIWIAQPDNAWVLHIHYSTPEKL